jgi:predicted nuclease with TOPRIM domain
MLKREINGINNKLRNNRDKREIVIRERQLLQDRIENLVGSIGVQVDARKRLRKEINEMNEAFKKEIREMAAEQKAAEELEECYFSDDEELVPNT